MERPHVYVRLVGEWEVRFRARGARLECRHVPTGVRLKGALHFHVTDFRGLPGGAAGSSGPWIVTTAWESGSTVLDLVSPRGDCQGYVGFESDGAGLRIRAFNRPRQVHRGCLRFEARLAGGVHAFACRTRPEAMGRVVQMASGAADSGLNDSIFDVARDRAVRFAAARTRIVTFGATGSGGFGVTLEAEAGATADETIGVEVLCDYYRSRYVPFYKPMLRKPAARPLPTGWMSWNTYFDQAGEEENLAEARIGARLLKPYGMDTWSIESWQEESNRQPVRDFHNLTMRAHGVQFPHGMTWLAAEIRKLGFRPGIWTVPFGTGSRAFYEAHKEWFLHHPDGRPMSNWNGLYALDPSQPAVRLFMEDTHRTMAEEWGYDFFKIDGISGSQSHYSAHFFERPEVRAAFRHRCAEPLRACLQALRRGIGPERHLLACQGHNTGPEVEVSDSARIGSDIVSTGCPPGWHNYHDQALRSQVQLYCHNILWANDPDTLLVGRFATRDVARLATTVIALPGQLMFAGDRLGELAADRVWMLQRALPVCEVRPLDLFPVYELRNIWDLKVRRAFASWDVVSVFNFAETEKEETVRFAELGLDPEAEYLAWEFWEGRFLGCLRDGFSVRLRPHSNALVSVHRALGRPQFVSTDRHVTQGAVSVENLAWSDETGSLSGRVALVAGETTTLVLHVPEGWKSPVAEAAGASVRMVGGVRRGILRIALTPGASGGSADWSVRFGRRP